MNAVDLLKINVNDHTEKKGNLTYLSWAWAWQEAIKADPQAEWTVKMFGESYDKPYVSIGDTKMVFVDVTMFGKTPLSRWPRTEEKQSFPLLDTLAFVACCVMGYTVLVML
jgi:hypothetical protein